MQVMEQQGRLDRAVEFLPDDLALAERARSGLGLARPENAVLLAYAKLTLYDDLLASTIPDDPYLGQELERRRVRAGARCRRGNPLAITSCAGRSSRQRWPMP
jgi:hypothetical protein